MNEGMNEINKNWGWGVKNPTMKYKQKQTKQYFKYIIQPQ